MEADAGLPGPRMCEPQPARLHAGPAACRGRTHLAHGCATPSSSGHGDRQGTQVPMGEGLGGSAPHAWKMHRGVVSVAKVQGLEDNPVGAAPVTTRAHRGEPTRRPQRLLCHLFRVLTRKIRDWRHTYRADDALESRRSRQGGARFWPRDGAERDDRCRLSEQVPQLFAAIFR